MSFYFYDFPFWFSGDCQNAADFQTQVKEVRKYIDFFEYILKSGTIFDTHDVLQSKQKKRTTYFFNSQNRNVSSSSNFFLFVTGSLNNLIHCLHGLNSCCNHLCSAQRKQCLNKTSANSKAMFE